MRLFPPESDLSPTLRSRFYNRINVDGATQPHCSDLGNCWEWTGTLDPRGYGYLAITSSHKTWHGFAHRLSWLFHHGEDPAQSGVLHKCDNPKCVRPDHLFLGSQDDNMKDMASKGRSRKPPEDWIGKLPDSQIIEMRRVNESGVSIREITRRFGTPYATLHSILNRKTYRNV